MHGGWLTITKRGSARGIFYDVPMAVIRLLAGVGPLQPAPNSLL